MKRNCYSFSCNIFKINNFVLTCHQFCQENFFNNKYYGHYIDNILKIGLRILVAMLQNYFILIVTEF